MSCLEGVDVVEHGSTKHPIGILLEACLASMQVMAICSHCWLQGSFVQFWLYRVWLCHAGKRYHIVSVGEDRHRI